MGEHRLKWVQRAKKRHSGMSQWNEPWIWLNGEAYHIGSAAKKILMAHRYVSFDMGRIGFPSSHFIKFSRYAHNAYSLLNSTIMNLLHHGHVRSTYMPWNVCVVARTSATHFVPLVHITPVLLIFRTHIRADDVHHPHKWYENDNQNTACATTATKTVKKKQSKKHEAIEKMCFRLYFFNIT